MKNNNDFPIKDIVSFSLANINNSNLTIKVRKGVSKETEHYAYPYILPRVVDIKDEKLVFEKDYNNVVFSAVEKIMNNNLYDYFSLENVEKIELDEELPYPQDFDL